MHSNCLFEALKAKIKHPNTVQILFLKGGVFGKYSTLCGEKMTR